MPTRPLMALAAAMSAALSLAPTPAAAGDASRSEPGDAREVLVVALKGDRSVAVHDARTGEALAHARVGDGPHEVAIAPDGRTAVVAVYGGYAPGSLLAAIDLGDLTPGAPLGARMVSLGAYVRPHGLCFAPDGRLFVTAEQQQAILEIDLPKVLCSTGTLIDGRAIARATGQPGSHMLALSPDASYAFVANLHAASVTAIPLVEEVEPLPGVIHKPEGVRTVRSAPGAEGVALSPDARELWVANNSAGTLSVFDAQTLERLDHIPCGGYPIRVRFTPDGSRVLVTAAFLGELFVYDAKTRERLARVCLTDPARPPKDHPQLGATPMPIGMDVSADGRTAYVSCQGADCIAVVDLEAHRLLRTIPTGPEPDGIAVARLPADDAETRDARLSETSPDKPRS